MNLPLDVLFQKSTQFWVYFIFIPAVVLFGVIGNSLTIYILRRKRMRIFSNNVYLTALTFTDLIFLLFSFSLSWKHYDYMKSMPLYWNYYPIGLWITDASRSTSVWLTVSFTAERYVAVRHPMLTKILQQKCRRGDRRFCKKRVTFPHPDERASAITSFIYPTCFLLNSLTSLEWRAVAEYPNDESNKDDMVYSLEKTDLGRNPLYRLLYHGFCTLAFVIVPFIALAVGNILLIKAVHDSQKLRHGLISSHVRQRQAQMLRQEDRITIILTVVILVFFICQLPSAAVLIYTSMYTPEKDSVRENILSGVQNICKLLMVVNAVTNFILYIAISGKYRQTFIELFCLKAFIRFFNKRRRSPTCYMIPKALPVKDDFRFQETAVKIEVDEVILSGSCHEVEAFPCINETGVNEKRNV